MWPFDAAGRRAEREAAQRQELARLEHELSEHRAALAQLQVQEAERARAAQQDDDLNAVNGLLRLLAWAAARTPRLVRILLLVAGLLAAVAGFVLGIAYGLTLLSEQHASAAEALRAIALFFAAVATAVAAFLAKSWLGRLLMELLTRKK